MPGNVSLGVPSALKTVPAPAAAVGYNTLYFWSDFRSNTVDHNRTYLSSAYAWFKSNWYSQTWTSTMDADISQASNMVTCNGLNGPNATFRPRLATAFVTSSIAYSGRTFSLTSGAYFEAGFAFDPALCQATYTSFGWPSFWLNDPRLMLTGSSAGIIGIEPDLFEAYPQANGINNAFCAIHSWTTLGDGNGTCTENAGSPNSNYDCTASFTALGASYASLNRYGARFVPMSQGAGTGQLIYWFNGSSVSGSGTTWTAGSTFAAVETGTYVMFIEGGPNWPCGFNYVGVWGP